MAVTKSLFGMRKFFGEKVTNGDLSASSVAINKMTVVKDTPYQQIVRIERGARLTPTSEIKENEAIILRDKNGTRYHLYFGGRGGMLTEDGDQTINSWCDLEKLRGWRMLHVSRDAFGNIYIPPEDIEAKVRIDRSVHYEALSDRDVVAGTSTRLRAEETKRGDLLTEFIEFVQG